MPIKVCFLHYREPLILVWCGIRPRCKHISPLLWSSRSSRQSGEWKKASHSLLSSFKDCLVWWELRPTWNLMACYTRDPYNGGSRQGGGGGGGYVGKPALHDNGHTVMPTCHRHVETTLVLVSGPGAGSSLSQHNASNGRVPHWPPNTGHLQRCSMVYTPDICQVYGLGMRVTPGSSVLLP